MKVTVHRGTHVIGGSCVEVTTSSTRLVLDLGLPLVTANRDPFDASAALKRSTAELLQEGTAPNIAGLFEETATAPDAILLSHAHLDHMGMIHLSRPEIPVYATSGTSKMMLAGAVFAGREELNRDRHRAIQPGTPFQIKDVQITPYAVDHSVFGSVAFLIEADGKRVLYTGDLRNHGRKPGMMRTLLEALRIQPVDLLVTEGTHLGSEKESGTGEFDLEEEVVRHIGTASGLVMSCFSPQDVDRLVTVYRASVRSGRTFVADGYTAFVLHLVQREANIPAPKGRNGIRVLFNEGFTRKKNRKLESLFEPDRIELAEVLAEPTKHVMAFRPSMTAMDFRGTLPPKARVLYGYWKGYLRNPDWVELQEQVSQVGGDFIATHASGHIYINDLIEFVRAVDAKTVIPIHTFEPQQLHRHFANVRVLNDGETFDLEASS